MSSRDSSIFDSELFPSGRIPIPWVQEALGKLKSPARMISGMGAFSLEMVSIIFLIIMLLNEDSSCLPRNLSSE